MDEHSGCDMTRRHALRVLLVGGMALVAVGDADAAVRWVSVGAASDFAVGVPRKVRLPDGQAVFVVRTARGPWKALRAACTHKGVEIGWSSSQKRFVCPAHGATFTAQGQVIDGPAQRPLAVLPVQTSGRDVRVDAGAAPPRPRRSHDDDDRDHDERDDD